MYVGTIVLVDDFRFRVPHCAFHLRGTSASDQGANVKQASVKSVLFVATVFAYGMLASVGCDGFCAGIKSAYAKSARTANSAGVADTTERKKPGAARRAVASRKVGPRASATKSKSSS